MPYFFYIKNKTKELIENMWKKGFFHLLLAKYFGQFVTFSSQILVAWILMPDDIGRLKVMQSFITIAVIFGGFGFNTSVLKLCSEDLPISEKTYLFNKSVKYL